MLDWLAFISFLFLTVRTVPGRRGAYTDLSTLVVLSHGIILVMLFHDLRDIKFAVTSPHSRKSLRSRSSSHEKTKKLVTSPKSSLSDKATKITFSRPYVENSLASAGRPSVKFSEIEHVYKAGTNIPTTRANSPPPTSPISSYAESKVGSPKSTYSENVKNQAYLSFTDLGNVYEVGFAMAAARAQSSSMTSPKASYSERTTRSSVTSRPPVPILPAANGWSEVGHVLTAARADTSVNK
jgi:hypothetical protein